MCVSGRQCTYLMFAYLCTACDVYMYISVYVKVCADLGFYIVGADPCVPHCTLNQYSITMCEGHNSAAS